jgi:thiamine kinase-like enzyme
MVTGAGVKNRCINKRLESVQSFLSGETTFLFLVKDAEPEQFLLVTYIKDIDRIAQRAYFPESYLRAALSGGGMSNHEIDRRIDVARQNAI